jgi:hypothetical protein
MTETATIVTAAALLSVGLVMLGAATLSRRGRWRRVEPFAGDERGAPEPVFVPPWIVYLVYAGWLLAIAGIALAALEVLGD